MSLPREKPDFHKADNVPNDTMARVRYQHHAPALVHLGSRTIAELLLEARALMSPRRREHFDGRVKVYAGIKPDLLRATGGDQMLAPPLRVVVNRGR